MPRESRLPKWLDFYRKLRKPTAPAPKPHRTKGYTKADRQRGKKSVGRDADQ